MSSERRSLEQLARSQSAARIQRPPTLSGRALGDSVAAWVARFNQVSRPAGGGTAGRQASNQLRLHSLGGVHPANPGGPSTGWPDASQRGGGDQWLEATPRAWNPDPTPFEWGAADDTFENAPTNAATHSADREPARVNRSDADSSTSS